MHVIEHCITDLKSALAVINYLQSCFPKGKGPEQIHLPRATVTKIILDLNALQRYPFVEIGNGIQIIKIRGVELVSEL
jgi:chorismate synthase